MSRIQDDRDKQILFLKRLQEVKKSASANGNTITEQELEEAFEDLQRDDAQPVSLTLPLREEPYVSQVIFPFFDGLIPEGWLLDVATKSWKINERDRMGLLLACCNDCIGAVSIEEMVNGK